MFAMLGQRESSVVRIACTCESSLWKVERGLEETYLFWFGESPMSKCPFRGKLQCCQSALDFLRSSFVSDFKVNRRGESLVSLSQSSDTRPIEHK